jgi:phage major head subunit gpT-like protein
MELNRANLNMLFTSVKTNYLKGRISAKKAYLALATIITSSAAIEAIPALIGTAKMREWIGPRLVKNLETQMVIATNKKYEYTVGIPDTAIADNQFGFYTDTLSQQVGFASEQVWDDMLFAAIIANANWVDGAAFFLAARKYGKNTIKNIVSGALTSTTYQTARQEMMSYVDKEGNSLQVMPDTLVVGPALETMAKRIVENEFWYDATDKVQVRNPFFGTAKVVICNEFVGNYINYWLLLDNSKPLKAFALIKRQEGEIVRQDKPTDEPVFTEGEIRYGAAARGCAVGVLPHLAYLGAVSP